MIKLQRNLFEGDFPLTQLFGENPDWYAPFGMDGHNGIDYATPTGTNLYCCIDGQVTEVAYDSNGYGKYIKIENDECGVLYAHMRALSTIPVGATVRAGDTIGQSGNTGNSTGPHLHFGVFPKPRDRSNGYAGYIDPFGGDIKWVEDYYKDEKCKELEAELEDMRSSRGRWKRMYSELEEKYQREISDKIKDYERLQKTNSEQTLTITNLQKETARLSQEATDCRLRRLELESDIDILIELKRTQTAKISSLEGDVSQLSALLAIEKKKTVKKVMSFTWWERFKSLFRRR